MPRAWRDRTHTAMRKSDADPAETVREIIDRSLYMVIGTADERGRPWVSPVYFAHSDYREFVWVSRPETLHSRNLLARPEIGIVVFDSSVPIGSGQGVYMAATAEELTGDARLAAVKVFSDRSLGHGGREWTVEDVEEPAEIRLYRATAEVHYILGEVDLRIEVELGPRPQEVKS
jgi:nitroimidazol reductase NimA-like FMN-containing flavoprotein (pyridoxamine 5'-phosphate oxidase superfamily)